MTQPLIPLRLSGLVSDVPPADVGPEYWTTVEGCTFRQGVAERASGSRAIYGTPTAQPYHLRNSFFDDTSYWIYGTPAALYCQDPAGTETDLTGTPAPSGATDPSQWSSCELNGFPVFNWGAVAPQSWDRNISNNFTPLTDWPSGYTCNVIRSFREYLVALNVYDGSNEIPSLVKWSDAAAPGLLPNDGAGTTWSAAANNDAGEFALGATNEGITDGLQLRDQFMVYKTHSCYLMSYVGGVAIMGQRQLSSNVGALSTNCVAELKGNHIVLTDGDVIITDGNQIKSLIDSRVRRALFSRLDVLNFKKSFVLANPIYGEVWICIPENGSDFASTALVWNSDQDKLSWRSLVQNGAGTPHAAYGNVSEGDYLTWAAVDTAATTWADWDSAGTTWADLNKTTAIADGLVAANYADARLDLMDEGLLQGGRDVQVILRKDSMDFGDRATVKFCREIYPRIVGDAGALIKVRIGTQDEPEDPISWSDYYDYTLGTTKKVDVRARGRFLSFELSSLSQANFRVTGMDVNIRQAGRYGPR